MISVDDARKKAESLAEACLRGLVRLPPERWLREEYLEEEHCWLFLKAKNLAFLPQCEESGDMAFVISKRGREMSVADHRGDLNALSKYLKDVSEYLNQRGE